jgi:hypothetical protein
MGVAANIVLLDAAGTPVSHTFVPIGFDKDQTFWFQDQSQANAVGFWKISLKLKLANQSVSAGTSANDRVDRVEVGLHEPILANITNSTVTGVLPAPEIAYVMRGIATYVLPERGSLLDKQNIRKMFWNLQNDAQIVALVETLVMVR